MNFLKQIARNTEVLDRFGTLGNQLIDRATATRAADSPSDNLQWEHDQHRTAASARRALFIGINYVGTTSALRGCIKDVENLKRFVTERCGFASDQCRTLTDDQATRSNMVAAMQALVRDARPGDSLFLHYSGHGARQRDQDGDETDGYDETICPVDYATAGMITDDELHAILCQELAQGVRLTAIFDCCHSGSALDLPFTYTVDGNLQIREVDNRAVAAKHALQAGIDFLRGDRAGAARGMMDGFRALTGPSDPAGGPVAARAVRDRTTRADVVLFSGCMDAQTSADAQINGGATGAMSFAFVACLEKFSVDTTYQDLLRALREFMVSKYSQIPQMSAGRQLAMDVKFQL